MNQINSSSAGVGSESSVDSPVKTLAKGLAALDILLKQDRLRTSDLAKELNIDPASASRILQTLVMTGFAERAAGRSYALGRKFAAPGTKLGGELLKARALPLMRRLSAATHESVYLGVVHDGQVLYLDRAQDSFQRPFGQPIGSLAPLGKTALGKVLLAYQDTLMSQQTIRGQIAPHVLDELPSIAESGLAFDDEERAPGTRCLAAPLRGSDGQILGAITIAAPCHRLPGNRLPELRTTLREIALEF